MTQGRPKVWTIFRFAGLLALLCAGLFFANNPKIVQTINEWYESEIANVAYAVGVGVGTLIRVLHI